MLPASASRYSIPVAAHFLGLNVMPDQVTAVPSRFPAYASPVASIPPVAGMLVPGLPIA